MPIAMLTAYDFPSARLAAEAGVDSLLVGDSLGNVILGLSSTRETPFALMLMLAEAVRRGAANVFLVGDLPFQVCGSPATALDAAKRFQTDAGCDAVKLECGPEDWRTVAALAAAGVATIAHLGLRPQQVLSPDGYRAQARDRSGIHQLVHDARRMVDSGASMLLLEAVPNEASAAVVAAVSVPVIGCGAGPACDGHVVVTHDMLGLGLANPPRFVPRLASLGLAWSAAVQRYVAAVHDGAYPEPQHTYPMKSAGSSP